jgi:hypothetical protein
MAVLSGFPPEDGAGLSPLRSLPLITPPFRHYKRAGTTLLQVFLVTDEPDAVPIDQFLIKDPLSPAAPMFPGGSYRLRIIDRKGKTLAAFHL